MIMFDVFFFLVQEKDALKPATTHQVVLDDEDGELDDAPHADDDDDELYTNVPFQKQQLDQRTDGLSSGDEYDPLDIMAAQRADELNGNMPCKRDHMASTRTESDESEEEEEEVLMEDEGGFQSGRVAHLVDKLTEEERTGKTIFGTPDMAPHRSTQFKKDCTIDKPGYRFQPSLKRPTHLATGGRNSHHSDDDVYEVRDPYVAMVRRDKEVGGEDHDYNEGTEWHVNEYYEGRIR